QPRLVAGVVGDLHGAGHLDPGSFGTGGLPAHLRLVDDHSDVIGLRDGVHLGVAVPGTGQRVGQLGELLTVVEPDEPRGGHPLVGLRGGLEGEGDRGDHVLVPVVVDVYVERFVLAELELPLPLAELAGGLAAFQRHVHRVLVHRGKLPLLLGQVHLLRVERLRALRHARAAARLAGPARLAARWRGRVWSRVVPGAAPGQHEHGRTACHDCSAHVPLPWCPRARAEYRHRQPHRHPDSTLTRWPSPSPTVSPGSRSRPALLPPSGCGTCAPRAWTCSASPWVNRTSTLRTTCRRPLRRRSGPDRRSTPRSTAPRSCSTRSWTGSNAGSGCATPPVS